LTAGAESVVFSGDIAASTASFIGACQRTVRCSFTICFARGDVPNGRLHAKPSAVGLHRAAKRRKKAAVVPSYAAHGERAGTISSDRAKRVQGSIESSGPTSKRTKSAPSGRLRGATAQKARAGAGSARRRPRVPSAPALCSPTSSAPCSIRPQSPRRSCARRTARVVDDRHFTRCGTPARPG